MAKKQHTLTMSEFRRLIRETAYEMLGEQDDLGMEYGEEEMDMVDVEPSGEEVVDDAETEEFEVDDLGEDDLELPNMESEEDVAAVLDDVAAVVQAAADALGSYEDVAEEMEEAVRKVKRAKVVLENRSSRKKSLRVLASLRKLKK